MSDYTPTTEQMREWHVRADHLGVYSRKQYEAQFDRWLNKVRAEAWQDGYLAGGAVVAAKNPYRSKETNDD